MWTDIYGSTDRLTTINGIAFGPHDLRALLDEQGWSTRDAASRIGVSETTINRWLDGAGAPNPVQQRALHGLAIYYLRRYRNGGMT